MMKLVGLDSFAVACCKASEVQTSAVVLMIVFILNYVIS